MTAPPVARPGLRLSVLVHLDFPGRRQPLFTGSAPVVQEILATYGLHGTAQDGTGNSFVAMSEALLARVEEPEELDAVLLAYQVPDLHHGEVAGCYLSDRLPGTPVPCSVAEQGPAAVFTALRIAEGMCRLGELGRGALFCYDQNAAVWGPDDAVQARPDSAVLAGIGTHGDVAVGRLTEIRTGEPGDPTPAQALQAIRADAPPGVRVLIGTALAEQLHAAGEPVPSGVDTSAPRHWCTGVWAALAADWPVREPVLVADAHPAAGRVHSCLLTPQASEGPKDR